ncbi:TlpA family protein disulfide reductase [Flavobacterium cellulosilyticum]|uniref:Redoxin domain-containing protein n=1 Tax=Flavobacterium cellulosilyticum TaxID=2541731 RepID=A0A4R5C8T2_9FLAO|nr:redoxin domain-containing protein [Flavobacterium cellulosilyticum]TDD95046.1 redoxin domain-containing protein [Flavobacterium cellulosilyticum]
MNKENTAVDSILVQDFNGNQIDLIKEYQGKPILVIIYNNQCLGCTGRAIPLAYQLKKENVGVQVVGIHSNFTNTKVTENDIKSIFTIEELPFPIFLDEGHLVYDQFDSEGTPQWLLITKDGILSRSIFGSQEGAQNRLFYALEQLD